MSVSDSRKSIHAASLPPAQPVFVLRGHASAIHSLHFLRRNTRLLSGDSDGNVVFWDLTIKRPIACWRAHQGSILAFGTWGADRFITHGRDNALRAWRLGTEDEKTAGFSTVLPVEQIATERKQPWLLHSLQVSTLNFCAFASCPALGRSSNASSAHEESIQQSLIVAVPGANDAEVALFALPSEKQIGLVTVPNQSHGKTGMVMTLHVIQDPQDRKLLVAVGYESGRVVVFRQSASASAWQEAYSASPHSQPVLGLDATLAPDCFFTSAADAVIAKHPFGQRQSSTEVQEVNGCLKTTQTGHPGQQGLSVRSDGRIFATAGWDGRVRIYSSKSLKELAVLKWHKEGVYAVAFAAVDSEVSSHNEDEPTSEGTDVIAPRIGRVAAAREQKTRETHWLAAGAKDGKISLWDIY